MKKLPSWLKPSNLLEGLWITLVLMMLGLHTYAILSGWANTVKIKKELPRSQEETRLLRQEVRTLQEQMRALQESRAAE